MAEEKKYYVFCGANCKYEGMTKEQILTAIENMATSGDIGDVDAGFITRIKDQNNGIPVKIWVGTQAQYNALTDKDDDTLYITDDGDMVSNIEKAVEEAFRKIEEAQKNVLKCSGHYANSTVSPITLDSPAGIYFFPQLNSVLHLCPSQGRGTDILTPHILLDSEYGENKTTYTLWYDTEKEKFILIRETWLEEVQGEDGEYHEDYNREEDIEFVYAVLCCFDNDYDLPQLPAVDWS
jgi:hypothetical protein